jgi:GntR family transcriptional regulator/MocR family aminotransferase
VVAPLSVKLLIPLSEPGEPRFRQIYLGVRQAILSGTLRRGERIPSTRDLAQQLGVSRTIVLLAYEQLAAEGFILGRGGSGSYVAEHSGPVPDRDPASSARFRLSRFGAAAEEIASKVDIPGPIAKPMRCDFAYGKSDIDVFPFETSRRLLLRTARNASVRDLDYGPAGGATALREAICAHLRRSRAVNCEPSQVLVVNGSQQGIDLIVRVLIERSDPVAIEDPQYQGAREVLRAAGARLHPVPVDRDGIDPDGLPKSARMAFVTPSHQFPTGAILSLSRRWALLQWAERTGAVIVEDDYDGEFRYEGRALESLQGLDACGRVIYIGTFSRVVFSALRIGYLVVPKPLVEAFAAAKWLSDRHTATLEQQTLADFVAGGMYERYLGHVRRRSAARRNALLEAIDRYLGDRVDMTGDGAGAHVVLWPRKAQSEDSLVSRAASVGVRVYGISPYFLRPPCRAGLLLGYARLSEPAIRDGIRRLANII